TAEIKAALVPICKKRGTCFAHPSNIFTFCDDVMTAEAQPICDRLFPVSKSAGDHEQCRMALETYLLGVEQRAKPHWIEAENCTKSKPPAVHTKTLDIWMKPAKIPAGWKDYVT